MNCTGSAENSSGDGSARNLYLLNTSKFDLGIHKSEGNHRERSVHLKSWERTMNYCRLTSELRTDSTTLIFGVEQGRVQVFG